MPLRIRLSEGLGSTYLALPFRAILFAIFGAQRRLERRGRPLLGDIWIVKRFSRHRVVGGLRHLPPLQVLEGLRSGRLKSWCGLCVGLQVEGLADNKPEDESLVVDAMPAKHGTSFNDPKAPEYLAEVLDKLRKWPTRGHRGFQEDFGANREVSSLRVRPNAEI